MYAVFDSEDHLAAVFESRDDAEQYGTWWTCVSGFGPPSVTIVKVPRLVRQEDGSWDEAVDDGRSVVDIEVVG